jgi:hypothetical protein
MKSINRKVLMTLVGVAVAVPFIIIASLVGIHATALAGNLRIDVLCVGLALTSVAVRIVDGHLGIRNHETEHGYVGISGNTDLQESSIIRPEYQSLQRWSFRQSRREW